MTRRAGAQAGFTLLEVLVALVIFGFIVAGLASGTRLGFAAIGRQSQALAVHGDVEPADRLLRRLIAGIALPGDPQQPGLAGDAAGMVCVTQALVPDASGMRGRVNAVVTTDEARRLVLRWSPHMHAERLGPLPANQQAVLLEGVQRIEISYLSPDRAGWLTSWDRPDLPALVRIRLIFRPGDPRRWPAIIAATQMTRPGRGTSG